MYYSITIVPLAIRLIDGGTQSATLWHLYAKGVPLTSDVLDDTNNSFDNTGQNGRSHRLASRIRR
jgi:hypothetical protein